MTEDGPVQARLDLAEWSAPLIADRIAEFYKLRAKACIGRPEHVRLLAQAHLRLWACLIKSRPADSGRARRDLVRLTRLLRIDDAEIDSLDREILDDLMDVVIGRFSNSRGTAHAYGMAIVSAATVLGEARHAA